MGFWDAVFGSEKENESSTFAEERPQTAKVLAKPFKISLSFLPLRLTARKKNSVNIIVKVTNIASDPQLVSVDIALPKNTMLGFEPTTLSKSIEKKVGDLKSGQSTDVSVPIWANSQTMQGNYEIEAVVHSHYQSYDRVLNYMKKKTVLRVV